MSTTQANFFNCLPGWSTRLICHKYIILGFSCPCIKCSYKTKHKNNKLFFKFFNLFPWWYQSSIKANLALNDRILAFKIDRKCNFATAVLKTLNRTEEEESNSHYSGRIRQSFLLLCYFLPCCVDLSGNEEIKISIMTFQLIYGM